MPRQSRRGSAMVLGIIVAVVVSSLVIAMSFVAGESAQRTGLLSRSDQAFFAAESGAQRVIWYCKKGELSTITSPLTGTVNGFSYSASWVTVSGTPIRVTSTATGGQGAYTLTAEVTPPAPLVPAMASKGNFNNRTVDVIGDVQTGGKYANKDESGSIVGNLIYATSAKQTTEITGTITKDSWSPLDLDALMTSLQNSAGATYEGNQTNVIFDFTALPGTHKVIYVNGKVKYPTFIGSGTLYANGNVTTYGFGTAEEPVHIVSSGRVNTRNMVTIHGSIYAKKNWNHGVTDFNGVAYVEKRIRGNGGAEDGLYDDDEDEDNEIDSGQWSFKIGNPPWFDTRAAGGGSTSTVITKVTGPQP